MAHDDVYAQYAEILPTSIVEKVRDRVPAKISKKDLTEVFERVVATYHRAHVHAGESVGLVSAESIGEPGTQMTLNTFHFAGVAEMNVTTGLPRIIEIFDARKTIKTPMMEIYLKAEHNGIEQVKKFAARVKETSLGELAGSFALDIFEGKLTLHFDEELLDDFSLDMKTLSKAIKTRSVTTQIDGNSLIFTPSAKGGDDVKELYALKEKLKKVKVQGVKGIKQVLPVKRGEEYIVLTSGINLKDILALEEVDSTRTTSNDIHEIYAVLGIEAARQAVITEVYKVIEAQGLNIDIRHIMLVADTMCVSGAVKGITRFGVVSEKASVLARASFETPIKHLINAALEGEVDQLSSVIENVMINQPVPNGTGVAGLITKFE